MAGLSADQLSAYLDDGFLLLEDVLSPADLQPLIDDVSRRGSTGRRGRPFRRKAVRSVRGRTL